MSVLLSCDHLNAPPPFFLTPLFDTIESGTPAEIELKGNDRAGFCVSEKEVFLTRFVHHEFLLHYRA